jgi:hypothetical protein
MIIYVTGKHIMDNKLLFEKAQYNHVPSIGLQYLYDGKDNYKYIFSTWNGKIDTTFPPNIQGGTIGVTYWYIQTDGGGKAPQLAKVCAMLLGGEGDDGAFITDNPISSVNGSQWSGGLSVSTANKSVDIVAKSALQSQDFSCWVKILGACKIQSNHYIVSKGAYCIAAAVYSVSSVEKPGISGKDVNSMVRAFINPRDLVADYMDERLRGYLDDIINYIGPSKSPDKLSKLIEDVEKISPRLVNKTLLRVKTEKNRLEAIEMILNALINK